MSIKDRIKFFENLKNNQDSKLLPRPLPSKLTKQKHEPQKSVTEQTIKPIHVQPKPIVSVPKNELESQQKPKILSNQISPKDSTYLTSEKIHNQVRVNVLTPQDLPKPLLTKSAQVISQSEPKKQFKNQDKNPQKSEQKLEPAVINVKNLRNMFEKKDFSIVQQPPIKSCIVPKNSLFDGKKDTEKREEDTKPQQKRISLPQQTKSNEEQKKLSFKQMRLIAQGLLSKTRAPPTKHSQEKQRHEDLHKEHFQASKNLQHHPHSIKVQLEQRTEALENETQKEKEHKNQTESDILFKQALRHDPENSNTLVTGQSNNLNLATRKTVARRRNNDDDFDDL